MTLVGKTSVPTAWEQWDTPPPILTVLENKGFDLPITMRNLVQPSSTAGRAAFITGQYPIRSGMTTVGQPGDALGLQAKSPSLAEVMKSAGYATGQFGKNHLGDRDEMLPTAHGFDEFFGNLYHLNAEEEPENPDYPKNPEFKKRFGPRGVMHSFADGRIKDTGPLTKKRMETMVETTDGFKIAEVDLSLRGPGDLLGTQQSGALALKIADLAKDGQLVQLAREKARAILATDAQLVAPENALLNQALREVLKNKPNWGRIS